MHDQIGSKTALPISYTSTIVYEMREKRQTAPYYHPPPGPPPNPE